MSEALICQECREGTLIWVDNNYNLDTTALQCVTCEYIYKNMNTFIEAMQGPPSASLLLKTLRGLDCPDPHKQEAGDIGSCIDQGGCRCKLKSIAKWRAL